MKRNINVKGAMQNCKIELRLFKSMKTVCADHNESRDH